MTSTLTTPGGRSQVVETVHGTVPRHFRHYREGKPTSTNPLASVLAWTGAPRRRGELDATPALVGFADTLDRVCVRSVERGQVTHDLAVLLGPGHGWLTTEQLLHVLGSDLHAALGDRRDHETQGVGPAPHGS